MSVRTRLGRLEARTRVGHTNSGVDHILIALAKHDLHCTPDLRLVEPQDTDPQTYTLIAWCVAVANGMRPANADRLYPRTSTNTLRFTSDGGACRVEMDFELLQRAQQAREAAVAAARARLGRRPCGELGSEG